LNFLKENLLYRWYGESPTLCIVDTESRRLPVSGVGESQTPHLVDTESRRLPVSLSQGVNDSAYRWYGESLLHQIHIGAQKWKHGIKI
jgi:hypothetical protein